MEPIVQYLQAQKVRGGGREKGREGTNLGLKSVFKIKQDKGLTHIVYI